MGFPCGSPDNSGAIRDEHLIPGLGRFSGGGHENPLPYSYLQNCMDRGARRLQSVWSHRVGRD